MSSLNLPGRSRSAARQPARTGFDMLDGAFLKVARARVARLAVIGVMTLGVVGLATQSLLVRLDAGDLDAQRTQAEEQLATLRTQVAEEADTGGLDRAEMQGHLDTLGVGTATVAYGDVPLQEVLRELDSRTPGNIRITDVTISSAGPDVVGARSLTMSAVAPGFDTTVAYRDTLQASPLLSDVAMTWTGGSEQLTLSVTASVSPSVETSRAKLYRGRFAPDLDPAEAATEEAGEGDAATDVAGSESDEETQGES